MNEKSLKELLTLNNNIDKEGTKACIIDKIEHAIESYKIYQEEQYKEMCIKRIIELTKELEKY